MLRRSRRRADAVYGGQSRRRPHRLVAQDTALSRRRHGFESRWGHARIRKRSGPWPRCAGGPRPGQRHIVRQETRFVTRLVGSRWLASSFIPNGLADLPSLPGSAIPPSCALQRRKARVRIGAQPSSPAHVQLSLGPARSSAVLCPTACLTTGAPVVCSSGRGRLPSAVPITGARRLRLAVRGPVEQLGVLATLSRWRSRVQIPSGPQGSPVRFHWGPSQVR